MIFERCPWYIAGPVIGLLMVGLRAVANKHFGALGGYVEISEHGLSPRRLGFRAYFLLGLVLGGLAFALLSNSFELSLTYAGTALGTSAAQVVLLTLAGMLMGFGARTAGGCTSGHGMSGMSVGSPASFAATATFFAVAVAVAHALFIGGVS